MIFAFLNRMSDCVFVSLENHKFTKRQIKSLETVFEWGLENKTLCVFLLDSTPYYDFEKHKLNFDFYKIEAFSSEGSIIYFDKEEKYTTEIGCLRKNMIEQFKIVSL